MLRTYMDDASGMIEGTPVRLNGITIGYLDKIELTDSRDPKRAVEFAMKVREEYLQDIPVDSVAGDRAPPTCWATSSSTSPRVATSQHPVKDGGEIAEPAVAGYSGADGAERQPAADRSRRS